MIEYEPMEEPRRVTFERMQTILLKHTKRASELKQLQQETWLAGKLNGSGKRVFDGDTTVTVRMQRMRAAIAEEGGGEKVCGTRKGAKTTFAQVFALIYGEPL